MNSILSKSLKDIFSKEVLFFVLKIGTLSFATSALLVWFFWGEITAFIASYLSWIPWEWLQTSGAKIVTFLLAYMIFIINLGLFTSLFSEKLLITLAQKHYPDQAAIGTPKLTTSLLLTLKASVIFSGLFLLLLAFLFIPIIGQIVLLYLWSVLLREPTLYDVGALFITDEKVLEGKKKKTRVLAMIASLFNYVPIANIFAPVFAQILFLHHVLKKETR